MTQRVWYAAYGSNLSSARFRYYLRGGTPPGTTHRYPGSRDGTEPAEMRTSEIDRDLVFGGASVTWGGGVAFVHPEPSPAQTRARLYLVTLRQFEDVVAQENWLEPGSLRVDDPSAPESDLGPDLTYGLVLNVGERDGVPVLTVTRPRGVAPAAPSQAYLRHVVDGLREAFDMDAEAVVAYLAARPGIAEALSVEDLNALFA